MFNQDAPAFDPHRRRIHGVLTSLTSALQLVVGAREHHALCIRTFGMIELCEMEWPLIHAARWDDYPEETKEALKQWHGWLKITTDSAKAQKNAGFRDVIHRSVVLLADVLENLTESFLQNCLTYEEIDSIGAITGRRPRDVTSAQDIRRSIRFWERSFHKASRLDRFAAMITTFCPNFEFPKSKRVNLDHLIRNRNSLTHELIMVSPRHEIGDPEHQAPLISDEEAQSYFDDLGDYILALMNAFRELA